MSNIKVGRRYNKMHGYNCNPQNCCGSSVNRSFLTKEEKLEILTEYREALEKEAEGVSERIKELESKK